MSASKYSPQISSALRILLKKGQTMVLYRIGLPSYDPLNPVDCAPVILHQTPCVGIVLPTTSAMIGSYDKRILDDPMQRRDFRSVMIAGATPSGAPLPFDPQGLDILRTREGNYRLLGATGLNPAGDGAILWNLGCTLDTQIDLDASITFEDSDSLSWELLTTIPNADTPSVMIEDSDSTEWELS